MGRHELEHLQQMLEQIAENFAHEADAERAAEAVASHLRRFWAPEMRAQMRAAQTDGRITLSPLAAAALARV